MNWPEVTALAERQHGLVTTAQVGSRNAVQWAISSGRLVVVRRGIYAVAGAPPSPWRDLAAALLSVDGVASHRSAAALHRLAGIAPGAVEVTVFNMRTPRLLGVTAHRASVLYADDVTTVHDLASTSVARTVVDLAASVEPVALQRMLDDGIVRRLCTADDVARCLDRSEARRGRRRLVPLLDARLRSDSHLEQVWLRRLQRAGLAPAKTGFQLVIEGRVLLLDFAWPAEKVGIEVDGWRPHATRHAFDNDRLRDLAAVRAGWTILRVTSRTPPSQLFATLRPLVCH
ncbi:MAG TPA: type IV toxin-antitoxin system AbiEi family antitoxin domain-containing protein [Acidimicrobiales bacterium]|nr:type IV toxin-antitoxin system AbiEi family antitoxin domain-containing protein [Acidimicrobiales bacterium]